MELSGLLGQLNRCASTSSAIFTWNSATSSCPRLMRTWWCWRAISIPSSTASGGSAKRCRTSLWFILRAITNTMGKNFPRLLDKIRDEAQGSDIHLLESDTFEMGGYRFFGATLWTDFALLEDHHLGMHEAMRMNDYPVIRS